MGHSEIANIISRSLDINAGGVKYDVLAKLNTDNIIINTSLLAQLHEVNLDGKHVTADVIIAVGRARRMNSYVCCE